MRNDLKTASALDLELVRAEWPAPEDGSAYLNTGSSGRKPASVLKAIEDGWRQFNLNPTRATFFNDDWWNEAREGFAGLLGVDGRNVLLTQNATQGLHLVLNSFLLQPGDELVTTTHEHGSLKTIARHLEETRGIVVRTHPLEPLAGSEALCDGVLSLVGERTRLVQVSEIDCLSGWRPKLARLVAALEPRGVPLLVDGAHSLGQGPCGAASYPIWVGSAHKWLCAPNGTGAVHVAPRWQPHLKPVWLGDRYYNEHENALMRFEFPGTSDVVRWLGASAACRLAARLGQASVAARQAELVAYLLQRLSELPGATIRTPQVGGEMSGMVVVTWEPARLRVKHLRDWLWEEHRIWAQPDYCYGEQGHGLRVSCHIANTEQELDRLVAALKPALAAR